LQEDVAPGAEPWEGYVDWRNRPATRSRHGGMAAASFVLGKRSITACLPASIHLDYSSSGKLELRCVGCGRGPAGSWMGIGAGAVQKACTTDGSNRALVPGGVGVQVQSMHGGGASSSLASPPSGGLRPAQRRAEPKLSQRRAPLASIPSAFLVSSPPVPVLLLSPDHLAAFPSFLSCFRTSDRWCSRPFRGRWLAPLSPSFCYQWPSISPLLSLPFTYSSCSLPTPSPATCPENSAPLAPIAPQKSKPTCMHCIRMTRPVGGCSWCWWIPLPLLARTHHRSNRTEHSRVLGAELVAALCPRSEDMGSCPPIWKAPLAADKFFSADGCMCDGETSAVVVTDPDESELVRFLSPLI
jgi:hypothetical protein